MSRENNTHTDTETQNKQEETNKPLTFGNISEEGKKKKTGSDLIYLMTMYISTFKSFIKSFEKFGVFVQPSMSCDKQDLACNYGHGACVLRDDFMKTTCENCRP